MPTYIDYHKSLGVELHALKNRIRDLTRHWPTDGEYKESALRTVLRRHLPASCIVGRGFIVTPDDSSSQLDLIIADGNSPTLFRDGELIFVTPDCVHAIIEVKTSLSSSTEIEKCAAKLAKVNSLCTDECIDDFPWLGIFSYEAPLQSPKAILEAFQRAAKATGVLVHSMSYGHDLFMDFCFPSYSDNHRPDESEQDGRWRLYKMEGLATSYFIGTLISHICGINERSNRFAWFPLNGKEKDHLLHELIDK